MLKMDVLPYYDEELREFLESILAEHFTEAATKLDVFLAGMQRDGKLKMYSFTISQEAGELKLLVNRVDQEPCFMNVSIGRERCGDVDKGGY